MSYTLSLVWRHFYKHFTSSGSVAALCSFRRSYLRVDTPKRISTVFSENITRHSQIRSSGLGAVRCYVAPSKSEAVVNDDSVASPYLLARICCPSHVSEVLSESLMCFGADSTTIDAEDDHDSVKEIWITSIFNINQNVKECISRAADSIGLNEVPNYEVEVHDHTDWIKQVQESFHPVKITEGIWIVPEWRNPPDPSATNIILNPGLAFGTGEHPTTKLCLLLLHKTIKGGESFLDYGTGSGVLAIAALKLGADLSVGFDIEPQAITSAQHNASLNNISPDKLLLSLVPCKGQHFEDEFPNDDSATNLYNSKIIAEKEKYDIVIANILFYPLLDLADRIVKYAKPGAVIGISGIISEQVPFVVEHYSQYLEDISVSMMDDWACLKGSKKHNS